MNQQIDPEVLKLCRWGFLSFLAHAFLTVLGLTVFLALGLRYLAESSTNLPVLPSAFLMYSSLLVFATPPIILAPVAYYELYKPLKNNTFTSKIKKWNVVLSVLGFPYGLIIGGLFLFDAYRKMGKL